MDHESLRLSTRQLLIALISACISACGGGGNTSDDSSDSHTLVAPRSAEPLSGLLADDGSIMPSAPDAVPVDPAARTRAGRYASSRQADQLDRALGEGVIRVNVECCGVEGVDQAIAIAYGVQAAGDLPNSTPVLVRSFDARLGAVTANRLADAGYSKVWLVTR